MNRRWTIKELQEYTDEEVILEVLYSRRSSCTNYYSPLYERLTKIINKLETKSRG